jgi:hypothetical protein
MIVAHFAQQLRQPHRPLDVHGLDLPRHRTGPTPSFPTRASASYRESILNYKPKSSGNVTPPEQREGCARSRLARSSKPEIGPSVAAREWGDILNYYERLAA